MIVIPCLLFVFIFILADILDDVYVKSVSKISASLWFVSIALIYGTLNNVYSWLVLLGLISGAIGDIFLLSQDRKFLLSGVAVFGIGHFLYFLAFLSHGISIVGIICALAILALVGYKIKESLLNTLDSSLKPIMCSYLALISLTVAASASMSILTGSYLILLAMILFYVSDYFVAKGVFQGRTRIEFIIAISLYYISQLIMAFSV